MFNNVYHNARVLITGHTGFKGSWLSLWLSQMGAKITGYSLQPPTDPNHFNLLDIDMTSIIGDIRDTENVRHVFTEHTPDIVFHLAAQPIVRLSYKNPRETFAVNVLGTVNVFEAAREGGTTRAIVNITSDKCYENQEWPWGYRETDPVGGCDPYSASKGCAELVTNCWRNSFFSQEEYGKSHHTLLASGRAGNVIDTLANVGFTLQTQGYSREVEAAADAKGAMTCAEAGSNPWGMVWLFQQFEKADTGGQMEMLSDHPTDQHRVDNLRREFASNPALFGRYSSNIASATPLTAAPRAPITRPISAASQRSTKPKGMFPPGSGYKF